MERKEAKLQLAIDQGADLAVCTTSANWKSKVLEFTDGKGVNNIFNSVAGNTLKDDFCVEKINRRSVNTLKQYLEATR